MIEKTVPLTIPPGMVGNGTPFQAAGRWADGNLVRFFSGTIQPIGGWVRLPDDAGEPLAALEGRPRAAISWANDLGHPRLLFGTHSHLYAYADGALDDITPDGFLVGFPDAQIGTEESGDYGFGAYGVSVYGGGEPALGYIPPDTWQLSMFGTFPVAVNTSNETIYVWDGEGLAEPVADAPSARAIVVTAERFVVALGADDNVRQIHWSGQEDLGEWDYTDPEGTSGRMELTTNGRIICGLPLRGQTLIWTDTDLHMLQYIGQPFIYRTERVGENCGIIGPNAATVVDIATFWMGRYGFYTYEGFVRPLPCEVADHVFNDLNEAQRAKVFAVPNPKHNEVWWFYPSSSSLENDSYVVYNYAENHWTVGALARAAGVPAGATMHPVYLSPDGLAYQHEQAEPPTDPTPFLESGPVLVGAGDNVMKVQRYIPDELTVGDTQLRLYSSFTPTGPEVEHGPYDPAQPTPLRVTARYLRLRFEQVAGAAWRLGSILLGVRPGGRR